MENILIIGSSGHAKVIIDIVEKQNLYKIIGLLDKFKKLGEKTLNYNILGSEDDIPKLMLEYNITGIIVAIGDNFVRSKVVSNVKTIAPNIKFVTAIHPNSSIGKNSNVGPGTVIMSGVSVNPNCNISEHCILNTNSSLDHDSNMGKFSSLAPHACTGGDVKIGDYSAIGINATILHRKIIGEHSVIGASALVNKDIGSFAIAYGTPATVIRIRVKGEKYL